MLWKAFLALGSVLGLMLFGLIGSGCTSILPTPVLAATAATTATLFEATNASVSNATLQVSGTSHSSPDHQSTSSSGLTPVTPAYWAHGYVRVLYAGDDALGREMAFSHAGDAFQIERRARLVDSMVERLTGEQAGDLDPRSPRLYFHVRTWAVAGPLKGQGDYLVVLRPVPETPRVLKVERVTGGIAWQP